MKKIIAVLLVAMLAMSASALAATYTYPDCDFTFDYNEEFFEITMDDHTDDEDLVILTDKNKDGIAIHLGDLDDGETFPTAEEVAEAMGVEVETMEEWGNFKNVLSYETTDEDGFYQVVFIAPVYEDDGDIDDILTVTIGVMPIEDEEAAMETSDWISEVVDTLKIIDD